MELFTVVISKQWAPYADKLFVRLSLAARDLHTSGTMVHLSCDPYAAHTQIHCTSEEAVGWQEAGQVQRYAAETISTFILDELEPALLRHTITGQYKYDDPAEVEAIEQYCQQLLNPAEPVDMPHKSRQRRQIKINDALGQHLKTTSLLNLDGFMRFRLQDYKEELREVAEYAIDEYIMDQQYQEFISLLKYFVYIQEAKIPVAHLMHHGGSEFTMYNEQMKRIDTEQFDGFTLELLDKEINFEDMIVSTLISVSPEHIVIHTHEPEEQVIKTIMQIFENRAKVCTYCKLCTPVLGGKSQDQLSP